MYDFFLNLKRDSKGVNLHIAASNSTCYHVEENLIE